MSVACQVCNQPIDHILSLGYMPPPNDMRIIGEPPKPQTWLPIELMYCEACELAQLGHVPEPEVAFPYGYPYTSGATPALRRNFIDLVQKCREMLPLGIDDLVVDIGSNDGTLLSCFNPCPDVHWGGTKVLGVEPTGAAELAIGIGIPTYNNFFNSDLAVGIRSQHGPAKVITCTNCFAHMSNVHDVLAGVKNLLADDGLFVTESHYLIGLIQQLQYDTVYAEHLRYYTVRSLQKLFEMHGLYINRVERIPTHGGSIRVFATKNPVAFSILGEPSAQELKVELLNFARQVQRSKGNLWQWVQRHKFQGRQIVGIGAPSRGATVINYCGLDAGMLDYVCEQPDSRKIGRYMPGTSIPVVDEARLYEDQPAAAILFSWHLADELIPKLRSKGYRGEIFLPCNGVIYAREPSRAKAFV